MATYQSEQYPQTMSSPLVAAGPNQPAAITSRGSTFYTRVGTNVGFPPSFFYNSANQNYSQIEWLIMQKLFAAYCMIAAYDVNPDVSVNPTAPAVMGGGSVMLTSGGTLA